MTMRVVLRFLCLTSILAVAAVAAPAAANCPATDLRSAAAAIADGHAWAKHRDEFEAGRRIDGLAFPAPGIASDKAFRDFLSDILQDPSEHRRLERDRWAFWDAETGTIVIVNRRAGDCGTAFRPNAGRRYFERQE